MTTDLYTFLVSAVVTLAAGAVGLMILWTAWQHWVWSRRTRKRSGGFLP